MIPMPKKRAWLDSHLDNLVSTSENIRVDASELPRTKRLDLWDDCCPKMPRFFGSDNPAVNACYRERSVEQSVKGFCHNSRNDGRQKDYRNPGSKYPEHL